ncbi:MAG: UDP-N-acetylmuramoyl-L-alanine--D-glutamate ligase [Candidatus Aminicenantes bacterium]|nr:UDP-N-acetylmuramoyl-L-alanine--D-glutamate ligase [Candidatus Aminicenantes bacterium]
MDLKGKKVVVVGFSRTGEALCRFLLDKRAVVTVSEKKARQNMSTLVPFWEEKGVQFETGGHVLNTFTQADLIVLSPGVPMVPELQAAAEAGVEIISEVELAFRFLKGKIIGVTGSNGKSTTATLIHKILDEGGRKAFLAGNIGIPLISFVRESREDHLYVTELSSFQLQHVKTLRASAAILLNITPDHLDWHTSFEEYAAAKSRLVYLQKKEDFAILNWDDIFIRELAVKAPSSTYVFSRREKVNRACYIEENRIILNLKGEKEIFMRTDYIPLFGVHNQENVMASVLTARLFGLSPKTIKKSIISFEGLEHRLEKTAVLNGITFYNDSKATNVDAALKSIASFTCGIFLILGGRDKGGDFEKLRQPVKKKVKKVYLIGEAKNKLRKALKGTAPLQNLNSLQDAVRQAYNDAAPGEVVLLAPACTSFDMFIDFEERGRVFKQTVGDIKKEVLKGKG